MKGGRDVEREEMYRVAEERKERRVWGAERSPVQIRKTRGSRGAGSEREDVIVSKDLGLILQVRRGRLAPRMLNGMKTAVSWPYMSRTIGIMGVVK